MSQVDLTGRPECFNAVRSPVAPPAGSRARCRLLDRLAAEAQLLLRLDRDRDRDDLSSSQNSHGWVGASTVLRLLPGSVASVQHNCRIVLLKSLRTRATIAGVLSKKKCTGKLSRLIGDTALETENRAGSA
eukprot:1311845-Rhodomonas_salina.1